MDSISDAAPQGTRLDPIGAPPDSDESTSNSSSGFVDYSRCHHNDSEEDFSTCLFSLTTHLAQIQFRLRQIIASPSEDRETLLEALEEFASKELPHTHYESSAADFAASYVSLRYVKQTKLLETLWCAVTDLKADLCLTEYKSSDVEVVILKVQILLQELHEKTCLKIGLNDCLEMSPVALKQKVSTALEELASSLIQKENIMADYRKQLQEMETSLKLLRKELRNRQAYDPCVLAKFGGSESDPHKVSEKRGIIGKLMGLFKMLIRVYTFCGLHVTSESSFNSEVPRNHWGNLRAKLQVAILKVREFIAHEKNKNDGRCGGKITWAVLKLLAPGIRDLMQHGLTSHHPELGTRLNMCFSRRWSKVHAWCLLVDYYFMKGGDRVRLSTARKLSQSFNLNMAEARPVSDEEQLLLTIDQIISLHRKYKRNSDAHFKAFICTALNAKKLVPWLGMIFQCDALIKFHYLPWSYVARTRFGDSLMSLEPLAEADFDLPVDFAIRQFLNIKDMFI